MAGKQWNAVAEVNLNYLSRLPVELHDRIFENLEYPFDCICLGLTCRLLWDVACRHIRGYFSKTIHSSWAGDRIVCAGSHSCRGAENLQVFLTEAEQRRFITGEVPNIYEFARAFYTHTYPWDQAKDLNDCVVFAAKCWGLNSEDCTALHTVLGLSVRPIIKEVEHPRILRNLSQRVYVRQEALNRFNFDFATKCMRPRCHRRTRIGFGHIIWMHTGWSTGSSIGMPQGLWAGDRFDFVANLDFLEVDMGDNDLPVEWKDVSDEVVKDLTELWGRAKEELDSDENSEDEV